METYPRAAVERAIRLQQVILRALTKTITWFQAAEDTRRHRMFEALVKLGLRPLKIAAGEFVFEFHGCAAV